VTIPGGQDSARGLLFDGIADLYDKVRPHYPTAIYDALAGLVPPPAPVLEIGAGSGQATVDLVQLGYNVIAIEPGPYMAALLKQKLAAFPNCQSWTGRFEDWNEETKFNLVTGGTSLHWLELTIMPQRVAAVMQPAGIFAPFWGEFKNLPEFQPGLDRVYEKGPGVRSAGSQRSDVLGAIERSGLFARLPEVTTEVELTYNTDQYTRLVKTFSATLAMSTAERESFIEEVRQVIDQEFNGRIQNKFVTTLSPFRLK
jgi:SAM-dependent methyltransferase